MKAQTPPRATTTVSTPHSQQDQDAVTTYYRCTASSRGRRDVITTGGLYEKIDDTGEPVQRKFGGYVTSDTPHACFSKSIAGCLFAVIKPTSEYPTVDDPEPITLTVYKTTKEPDIDLTGTLKGDFQQLEEVRYTAPADNPIAITRHREVAIPASLQRDVVEAYNPNGPHAPEPDKGARGVMGQPQTDPFGWQWADAVMVAINEYLRTGSYDSPDPSETLCQQ